MRSRHFGQEIEIHQALSSPNLPVSGVGSRKWQAALFDLIQPVVKATLSQKSSHWRQNHVHL
jgi:hypothetical protein